MGELITAILIVGFLIFTALAVGAGLLARRLIRANRVAPGRRSRAPMAWLVSPEGPARLHRRLRRAATTARLSASMAPAAMTLQDVAGELVARAVTLDDCLVASGGLHRLVRRPRLYQLAAEVREIEVSAGRLHQLSSDWRLYLDHSTSAMAVSPPNLHERLDSVEAALRELPSTNFAVAAVPLPAPVTAVAPPPATARITR